MKIFLGQAVNYQNSGIFYISNVRLDKQNEISGIIEIWDDLTRSKHLGLPSLVRRYKKYVFNFVKDKV